MPQSLLSRHTKVLKKIAVSAVLSYLLKWFFLAPSLFFSSFFWKHVLRIYITIAHHSLASCVAPHLGYLCHTFSYLALGRTTHHLRTSGAQCLGTCIMLITGVMLVEVLVQRVRVKWTSKFLLASVSRKTLIVGFILAPCTFFNVLSGPGIGRQAATLGRARTNS